MLISAPRAASAAAGRRQRRRCAPPRLAAERRKAVPGAVHPEPGSLCGSYQMSEGNSVGRDTEAEHLLAPLAQILPGTVASVSI